MSHSRRVLEGRCMVKLSGTLGMQGPKFWCSNNVTHAVKFLRVNGRVHAGISRRHRSYVWHNTA